MYQVKKQRREDKWVDGLLRCGILESPAKKGLQLNSKRHFCRLKIIKLLPLIYVSLLASLFEVHMAWSINALLRSSQCLSAPASNFVMATLRFSFDSFGPDLLGISTFSLFSFLSSCPHSKGKWNWNFNVGCRRGLSFCTGSCCVCRPWTTFEGIFAQFLFQRRLWSFMVFLWRSSLTTLQTTQSFAGLRA